MNTLITNLNENDKFLILDDILISNNTGGSGVYRHTYKKSDTANNDYFTVTKRTSKSIHIIRKERYGNVKRYILFKDNQNIEVIKD